MKKIAKLLLAIVLTTPFYYAQAQDESFNDLSMNGLAAYTQLRKQYYVGALYLESLSQDPSSIVNMAGKKRMEIRISIDKWSPRRFSKQWNEAIYLNNDEEIQEEFADQIEAFIDIPRDNLTNGDIITIDMDPDSGTTVYLDGKRLLKSSNNAFFYVLLNTWIGDKPPSSDFKSNILTLPTDQTGTDMLVEYQGLGYDEKRQQEVATWLKPAKEENDAPAELTLAMTSAAALPPSTSGTTVTARAASPKAKPQPTATSTPVAEALNAPAPVVEIEKPQLAAASAPAPEPVTPPKPEPKPEPKAEPKPEPKEEVAKISAEELAAQEAQRKQDGLLKAYRSNVLALTYQNTIYPKRSISLGHEGLVVYKITVNRKGKVIEMQEEKMADHSLLNKAAKKAIKKASPFPEAPDALEGEQFEFSLPFNFKL